MPNQTDLHNRAAGHIVSAIVKTPLESGGKVTDVMVLLESVIVGVSLAVIRLGGDDKVLDTVMEGAKARLAEIRLGPIKTDGKA